MSKLIDGHVEHRTDPAPAAEPATEAGSARGRGGVVRRVAMRPRRVFVKAHRWVSLALLAWLAIVAITGAWLVTHDAVESWINPGRYASSPGDVGPDAAAAAAAAELPDDATVWGVTLPRNGRGVYLVGAEIAGPNDHYDYYTVFVDPGTGDVNGIKDDEAGFSWWLYRGHMYLWQDHGVLGAFDPETGWCRADPGGVKGVVCNALPDGGDMVAWFGVGWIFVLLTGFYLWYWPGVKRWARALAVKRGRGKFTFSLSLHKAVGIVFLVPLLVISFTGIAFAFPNLKGWFENVTPAQRSMELWHPPEEAEQSEKPAGREPIGLDRFQRILEDEYPNRAVQMVMPPYDEDKRGVYTAWVTRGFDPWTREQGAGNVYVVVDQYTGEIVYDGTPEEGNSFDQLWSDWSFPLHTGDFGGTVTRLLWVLVGLSPLILAGTGVTMWVIRWRKRSRRPGPPPVESTEPPPSGSGPATTTEDARVGAG